MVKADLGYIEFEGSIPVIATDICCIIRKFREFAKTELGDVGDNYVNNVIELSYKTDDELKKGIKEKLRKSLRELEGILCD